MLHHQQERKETRTKMQI